MNEVDITPLRSLVKDLISRDIDPGEIHVCPLCNGILHVSISGYAHGDQARRFAVYTRCENCKTSVIFELDNAPPWVKEANFEFNSIEDALEKLGKKPKET